VCARHCPDAPISLSAAAPIRADISHATVNSVTPAFATIHFVVKRIGSENASIIEGESGGAKCFEFSNAAAGNG
jgi:hypothetical protein